jgi:hypothetical protein
MAYHDVTGMRFTDAVYQLTFFGNARFEGDAAILAPSAVEQQRYQTLGFGIKHATRETFLRLDLVNGQYLNAVRLDRGYLYTAQDGTSLEADVDGSWYTSDTAGQQFGKSNGLGLSISGALELRSNTMRYSLRVEDLGFIAWNSNAQQLLQNDVISYDGLHVEDILDLSGSVLGDNWISDTLGLNTTSGGFLRPLPARFQTFSNWNNWPSRATCHTSPGPLHCRCPATGLSSARRDMGASEGSAPASGSGAPRTGAL